MYIEATQLSQSCHSFGVELLACRKRVRKVVGAGGGGTSMVGHSHLGLDLSVMHKKRPAKRKGGCEKVAHIQEDAVTETEHAIECICIELSTPRPRCPSTA